MNAKIIWLTGLSGAGKTTISNALYRKIKSKKYKVKQIDGDNFRKKRSNKNSFSKKNIIKNNISIISYVKKIKNKYDFILVSVISPILKTRVFAKRTFKKKYYEVYVYCGLKTLIKRDTKGLYKKAKEKIIRNLIGFNSEIKYEKSKYKKILINTKNLNLNKSVKKIYDNVEL